MAADVPKTAFQSSTSECFGNGSGKTGRARAPAPSLIQRAAGPASTFSPTPQGAALRPVPQPAPILQVTKARMQRNTDLVALVQRLIFGFGA
ncbi:hypothetical protein PMAA_085240 [Talaromyces marneffei ATCC 18224]|uniref:Uncharacterized protein n=1 Tax=Talaromyces marneffei (strain ATCC 18224 / CBS 334.59 / QM 7333) TaxID=441960 RepID=B6QGE2_TALMQ|nr:hypothetical protein PMAA_085240 [Talaromyces marneffei ATCC 18224]